MTDMDRQSTLDLVSALTQTVFPDDLSIVVGDPKVRPVTIDPAEAACIANAVPQRQTEFHAGRQAVRTAMSKQGVLDQSVLCHADRSPIWPKGLVGSISHNHQACLAVVGRSSNWASVGVDLEDDSELNADIIPEICIRAELAWINKLPHQRRASAAKLIFCAKEATYKAQYPLTGVLFGFEHLHIEISQQTAQFQARFLASAGRFEKGATLTGRYAHAAGVIVAGMALDPIPTFH